MLNRIAALTLNTERLQIRAARRTDLEEIYQIHRLAEVNQYLPYDTWAGMDDANTWYDNTCERRRKGEAEQFIILSATALIGTIIVFNYCSENREAEIGYVLGLSHWRKGFMQEALAHFIPRVAAELNIRRLHAKVNQDNVKSTALLGRLGFKPVGTEVEADGTILQLFVLKNKTGQAPL